MLYMYYLIDSSPQLNDRYYNYFHFIDKKTKAQMS